MKNPKLTVSIIITILTTLYSMMETNAEVLNIDAKTLSIVSLVITAISMIWKNLSPNESLFAMVKRKAK